MSVAHPWLTRPEHLITNADKFYIRRFLRARQHDLERAKHMYADHVKWRKEFDVNGIVKDFKFHERDLFLTLYPQGYHKTDKLVMVSSEWHRFHDLLYSLACNEQDTAWATEVKTVGFLSPLSLRFV